MRKSLLTVLCLGVMTSTCAAYAFDGPPPPPPEGPMGMGRPPMHKMMKKGPDMAKIDARLKLTVEQKAKLEANREADRKKLDPIMKKMGKKHHELQKLRKVQNPNALQKKRMEVLRKDMNKLRTQADAIRKENMKAFEAILTPAQKTEFAKIKAEHKAQMIEHRKKMDAERKKMEAQGKFPPRGSQWGPPPRGEGEPPEGRPPFDD